MSLWYDRKQKEYATKGSSSWIKYYAEYLVDKLKTELLSKLTSHYQGGEGQHEATQIRYDNSVSVKQVIDANRDTASQRDDTLERSLTVGLKTKVDKISGKGLSANDYTNAEKTKLDGIQEGAQVNAVWSVAGRQGAVVLEKEDVGLQNVDNTGDMDKPISQATQAALDQKADVDHVLTKTNMMEYLPSEPYHPTTKEYVDDQQGVYDERYLPVATAEGVPAVTEKTVAGDARNYQIYGSSVQNGTPTHLAPVEVESVGDLVTEGEYAGKYKVEVMANDKAVAVYLDQPLRKIRDYADYIDFANQKVVRKIYRYTFKGTEAIPCFTDAGGAKTGAFSLPIAAYSDARIVNCTCNYFRAVTRESLAYIENATDDGVSTSGTYIRFRSPSLIVDTNATMFKAFLAEKYAEGNPVEVCYILANEIEEDLFIPALPLTSGETVISCHTAIQPDKIWVQYQQSLGEVSREIQGKADEAAVLTKTNTEAFTPSDSYQPATKKYVDDSVSAAGGGDMLKSVYDTTRNGVVDNAERLDGQLPAYYAKEAHLTALREDVNAVAAGKVDKAEGKGLSSSDYTHAEKEKLAAMPEYAPPSLTTVTPRGTKIGTEGWTGTGYFCTDTDELYRPSETHGGNGARLPGLEQYTRFCLRPAELESRAYRNWTPYYVSGDTEIEFFWSPARGLYEGLVLFTEESAEELLEQHILWRYHPPVQMRYGILSCAIQYRTEGTGDETIEHVALRDAQYRRDFSAMPSKIDSDIMMVYSYDANKFVGMFDELTPTEVSFFALGWDVSGRGVVDAMANVMSIGQRSSDSVYVYNPYPVETIDQFAKEA